MPPEKEELLKLKNGADGEHEELSRILSWADVYDLCDFDTKIKKRRRERFDARDDVAKDCNFNKIGVIAPH